MRGCDLGFHSCLVRWTYRRCECGEADRQSHRNPDLHDSVSCCVQLRRIHQYVRCRSVPCSFGGLVVREGAAGTLCLMRRRICSALDLAMDDRADTSSCVDCHSTLPMRLPDTAYARRFVGVFIAVQLAENASKGEPSYEPKRRFSDFLKSMVLGRRWVIEGDGADASRRAIGAAACHPRRRSAGASDPGLLGGWSVLSTHE